MSSFVRLPCEGAPVGKKPASADRAGAWVLAAAILGSSMSGIDGTAVNVALPVIQRELRAGSDAMQWVIEGYSLFLSALILVGGSLGDRFGRRRIFLLGVLIFATASAACGASLTMTQLIAARCIQGIGGALLVPQSLALITASFDERDRGAAIGTWSGFSAMTMAVGPVLGGWFVQALSWRLVFVINIPVALGIAVIARRFIAESRDEEELGGIDWIGATAVTAALGMLVYGFITLQNAASARFGIAVVCSGAAVLVLFLFIERTSPWPMVPLRIFSSRVFAVANLYTLLLYAGLGASFFFIPFNLINVQQYTPSAAGAALLPMIAIMFVSSRWSGGLVSRVGSRLPLTAGALIAAAGFVLFARAGVGASYWVSFFPAIVVLGAGASVFVAPLTTTVMNSAPAQHAGSASGINNAISRVAGLLAIAVLGIVIAASAHEAVMRSDASLPSPVRAALRRNSLLSGRVDERNVPPPLRQTVERMVRGAYVSGFRNAMLACAALGVLSALIAFAADSEHPAKSRSAIASPRRSFARPK